MSLDQMNVDVLSSDERDDGDKKGKKTKSRLLRLFLVSDFRNPKIRNEVRSSKVSLLRNMQENIVSSHDIAKLFWIYAARDQDIPLNRFLKPHLSSYFVQLQDVDVSVKEYMDWLRLVRNAMHSVYSDVAQWKLLINKCLQDKNDDLAEGTEFGYEDYTHSYRRKLTQLYTKKYPFDDIIKLGDDLLIHFKNGGPDLHDIIRYVVLMSFSAPKAIVDWNIFSPYLDMCIIQPNISLRNFLYFLQGLHFANNIFYSL